MTTCSPGSAVYFYTYPASYVGAGGLFFTMRAAGFTQGPWLLLGQMSRGRVHHSMSAFEPGFSCLSTHAEQA